ncbi:hypothetical protein [Prescottella defluvii]|uniref:hypothetical protein n=1 Tax=Prescottella defluvii TaxID=1323361 RepID=UPI0012E07682|nr:hypothetical protein [Prescottella defluvii]
MPPLDAYSSSSISSWTLLQRRAAAEVAELALIATEHAEKFAVVPALTEEPVGVVALGALSVSSTAIK